MNKKVLITGSSRGIGQSIGHIFSEKNWDVCFSARNTEDLDALKKTYSNENHLFEILDFTNLQQIEQLYKKIQLNWGKLDSIIFNVGSGSGEKSIRSSFINNLEIYRQNFYSAYFSSKMLSLLLINSDNPNITFIGSIAANINVDSPINYAMAKKSIENLAIYLSIQLANHSIRVNVVHPGHTLTKNGHWEKIKQNNIENFNEYFNSRTLVKDILHPEEVANFIYEISNSKYSKKLTGSIFDFDAGSSRVK